MLTTLLALLPIILITALGYLLERTGLISKDQWRGIERLAYFLLFPAILFKSIAMVDFASVPALEMGLALLCAILVMIALVLLLRPVMQTKFEINGPRFTSIFQGAVRWNGFLALAMADSLMGPEGVALLAVAMVVMIPVLNVSSILVLSRWGKSAEKPSAAKVARDLYTNPFNIAIAVGVVFNVLSIPIPGFAEQTLNMLGAASLPVGIICVGAGLDLNALRRPGPALTLGAFIRLLISPLVGATFAYLFGVTGNAHTAIIIACSVPSASNAFLLARLMGGDTKLMAEILTLQTLAAIVTIPLALALLN
ncbi:AEC family transporter [Roseibium limicola]|uniref:AEC family transporter n=1 Tax=Roseibium limicola TaxID=2816037 RepID=A0A939EMS4_9HYPH|nr:AEC family transporter [Roseibium limicola]MBO0344732.1 AEC family transporter [Roseibium limicola]